jgi:hypothetical protein
MSVSLGVVREPFRALCVAFVPESAELNEHHWIELETEVGRALADRPPAIQKQMVLLIRILDLLARARHGSTLASLTPAVRRELLSRLQDSRWLLLRRGVWGLRTLAFLGYYSRPDTGASIGYRADARGWEARG